MTQANVKPNRSRKIFIITTGLILTTGAGIILYKIIKNKKTAAAKKKAFEDDLKNAKSNSVNNSISNNKKVIAAVRNDEFPLRKGSKGERVKQLQAALINSYGKSILPKFGADGDFGTETEAALSKISKPTVVNEEEFNKIVKPATESPYSIGLKIFKAAVSIDKDIKLTTNLLKQLSSTSDYSEASTAFKKEEINGQTQTLVSGLFDVFRAEADRQQLRVEFSRMGLERVYDDVKKDYIWKIPALNGPPIITRTATKVWVNRNEGMDVPGSMVLGKEISKQLDYTQFENNGRRFLVLTKDIQYL